MATPAPPLSTPIRRRREPSRTAPDRDAHTIIIRCASPHHAQLCTTLRQPARAVRCDSADTAVRFATAGDSSGNGIAIAVTAIPPAARPLVAPLTHDCPVAAVTQGRPEGASADRSERAQRPRKHAGAVDVGGRVHI